ncbi:glycosyltransferase involved in cell wall biosynthesis [Desulfobaculum xiamenense]|uniref:Glycosyltransferase involved in cell wall biosynthesis n=1 Tax=Desulfobaculum xiamenense TaxID=995050 RepID=A0A846QEX6_9BACT|nr:glycosyltransferase [Desulfobaculum xiamenense]NJB67316.1 glycosyltransferase involved in cell wall biosynthesis [Desulfobaculum xiamenense]
MQHRMTILHLDLGRELRGGQRQVLYLCRHLAASREYRPVIAAPGDSPLMACAREEGIETVPLPSRFEWHPATILFLRTLILRERIDCLHTHCARSASLGAVLKRLCGGRPLLVHSRRVSYPLGRGWSRRKYAMGDAVVGVSAEIAATLRECGLDADKVSVIHSGIDPARYVMHRPPLAGLSLRIGMVGALSAQKGHAVLIDALSILTRDGSLPAWDAEIVGDGALRAELEAKVRQEGLAERVLFSGYRESREVLPGFDILAVPSIDGEGSSGVIKEGWASCVPVVTSDLPSNLELVQPGYSGLSFANGDGAELARVLTDMLHDIAAGGTRLCNALVEGGRARLEYFTDMAMARAYMALYAYLRGTAQGH